MLNLTFIYLQSEYLNRYIKSILCLFDWIIADVGQPLYDK